MNSGFGPTLTFIVGGILWLLYLAPGLRDRAETKVVERNARRIAATTQDLGIRPLTPMSEMSTQELVAHRREMERLARARDRVEHNERQRAAFAQAPELAARRRLIKIVLSLVVLVALGGTATAMYFAAWAYVVLSVGIGLLSLVGLFAVNTAEVPEPRPVVRPARKPAATTVDRTWTPVRTPPVHDSMPVGAGLIVTSEQEKAVAARERAARIREQAARAAGTHLTADPRFTEPTIDTSTSDTAALDINAALRARRAN